MTDLPAPRIPGAAVFTTRLPAVQRATAPAADTAQHALGPGPAPLFDPDLAAVVDPPLDYSAAAVETCGEDLADDLAGDLAIVAQSGWFAPAVPAAALEHGSTVPARDLLLDAADVLREQRRDAVRAWLLSWCGVEVGRSPT